MRKIKIRPVSVIWTMIAGILVITACSGPGEFRSEKILENEWSTLLCDSHQLDYSDFEQLYADPGIWQKVHVPHNWDDYGGYRRLVHGNLHGYAWYYRNFTAGHGLKGKQVFLWFEGISSYATVWVNGQQVGEHAGGRTSFTLDITDALKTGEENLLVIRADHPAGISDLPWVCGGCSPEWGFSEGSQPFGIFRPVRLVATNPVRIEPFGVHIWNDDNISAEKAGIRIRTEVKNHWNVDEQAGENEHSFTLVNRLLDKDENQITAVSTEFTLEPDQALVIEQKVDSIMNPELWSPGNPYLYRLVTEIQQKGKALDRETTLFGIRWIKWDIDGEDASGRFFLNGKPVFINGTAEYEHLLGGSHAFSDVQIRARVEQFRAAGFNAFRDAHQPHNLGYHPNWDSLGILWWPQMAAHIWFDTPEFRDNFKSLIGEWVRERRNSPSIILWGLENESTLPEDFARECTELIRQLDPTTSSQRKVTTCNGGVGTDWNVVQNWSGTYGGDPWAYDRDISRQNLNGEYGAWRSLGLHTEGPFIPGGPHSEDRMCLRRESKIRRAESVKDRCSGQFQWPFISHDNPGRRQSGEGLRDLDRLGPVNYKGLFTIWGEPTDVYYMYRANYTSSITDPMLYIVSHTWPDRWPRPGIKDGIRIFSNCDSVELFNDFRAASLGVRTRNGIGTHFIWNGANIRYNVLYAVGYVGGREAAQDYVVLHHLPEAPSLSGWPESWHFSPRSTPPPSLSGSGTKPSRSGRNYLYRVNCGGPAYTDSKGNLWSADIRKDTDDSWGSLSWTDDYEGLPPFYGSQRRTYDPIRGSNDWPLLQHFRYGRHKLAYEFPVPAGEYDIELLFIEPWYGTGGGFDCRGWRVFDVAVNGELMLEDLDIWKEAGHDSLLWKSIRVRATDGQIRITFPRVSSGQAIISAIAISACDANPEPAPPGGRLIFGLQPAVDSGQWSLRSWLDTGMEPYSDDNAAFSHLSAEHYGAEWIKTPSVARSGGPPVRFTVTRDATVLIGVDRKMKSLPAWLRDYEATGAEIRNTFREGCTMKVYRRFYPAGTEVELGPNPEGAGGALPMYSIAVTEHTNLVDAIDLRPVTRYQAEDSEFSGGAKSGRITDRNAARLTGNGDGIEWEFRVGLASRYALEFRYMNMSGRDVAVNMKILGAGGLEYWKGDMILSGARARWQSLRTDTGTMINAGAYRIIVTLNEDAEIYFDWLQIQ